MIPLTFPEKFTNKLFLFWVLSSLLVSWVASPFLRYFGILFFILAPFLWAVFVSRGASTLVSFPSQGAFPWTEVSFFCFVGFILRFYDVRGFSGWPLTDEGVAAYYAAEWNHGSSLRWLYGFCESPPMGIWMLGFWFKIFGISLSSLSTFPVFVSVVTLLSGVWASWRWAGRPGALAGSCFISVGYPFLFMGRLALSVSVLLPWMFWMLACFAPAPPTARSRTAFQSFGLGCLSSLGPYIFHQGFLVAFWASLIVWMEARQTKHWRAFRFFLLGFLLFLAPLVVAMSLQHFGGYWRTLASINPTLSNRAFCIFSYLSTFWYGPLVPTEHSYDPLLGGYWDPILGAFILLGTVALFRAPKSSWSLRLLPLCFFLFLPALITSDVEPLRVLPITVPAVLIALVGYQNLIQTSPNSKKPSWIILGFILMALWSSAHLFGFYRARWGLNGDWNPSSKNAQDASLYQIIGRYSSKESSALPIFGFISGDPSRMALHFAVQGSNPPSIQTQAVRVAILMRPWEIPLVQNSFPKGKIINISSIPPRDSLAVYIVGLSNPLQKTAYRWNKLSNELIQLEEDRIRDVGGLRAETRAQQLESDARQYAGDPFPSRRCLFKAAEEYRLAIISDVNRFGSDPSAQAHRRALRDLRQRDLLKAADLLPGAPIEPGPSFP